MNACLLHCPPPHEAAAMRLPSAGGQSALGPVFRLRPYTFLSWAPMASIIPHLMRVRLSMGWKKTFSKA